MKALVYLLTFVICSSAVLTQAAEPVSVQIKSFRKCEATVEQTGGAYIIDVKMASINCFDVGTNELLSVRKTKNLALVALLKYLNPDKKNTFFYPWIRNKNFSIFFIFIFEIISIFFCIIIHIHIFFLF